MRSEQNEGDRMLGTSEEDWIGLIDHINEYKEEELMSPPMQPNGGGGWSDTCPYGVYLTYDECLQYHGWDEEYCSCVCLVGGACGDEGVLPSFSIDDDEYQQCLQDEIVEIGTSYAACIVGGVGGYAVAALLITAAGTISPDITLSKATAGTVGAASIVYFANIIAGCVGGVFYNHMTDGVTALACGMYALEWN